jgi:hypothetical protein
MQTLGVFSYPALTSLNSIHAPTLSGLLPESLWQRACSQRGHIRVGRRQTVWCGYASRVKGYPGIEEIHVHIHRNPVSHCPPRIIWKKTGKSFSKSSLWSLDVQFYVSYLWNCLVHRYNHNLRKGGRQAA